VNCPPLLILSNIFLCTFLFWLLLFLWFLFDVSILSISIQYLVALCVWTKYYFQLQSKLNILLKDLFLKLPRIIIISTDISQKLKTANSFVVVLMFWKLIPAKIQAQASQISKARLLNFPSKNFVKGYNCKVYLFIYLSNFWWYCNNICYDIVMSELFKNLCVVSKRIILGYHWSTTCHCCIMYSKNNFLFRVSL
jgi:hypothetical protein